MLSQYRVFVIYIFIHEYILESYICDFHCIVKKYISPVNYNYTL